MTGHEDNRSRTRRERDSLGERDIPVDTYFGIQTLRAVENFSLSDIALSHFPTLVRALAMVKKAAAISNHAAGQLPEPKFAAIVKACDDIIGGSLMEPFVVDVFQGGAGTSSNMNANEVIANRALELPLYNLNTFVGINKRVKGFVLPGDNRYRFTTVSVD